MLVSVIPGSFSDTRWLNGVKVIAKGTTVRTIQQATTTVSQRALIQQRHKQGGCDARVELVKG